MRIKGIPGASKARALVTIAVVSLAAASASARAAEPDQGRYMDHVFSQADVQSNLVYGRAINDSGALQDLKLDLYQPAGDLAALRPVVIYAHGGAFTKGYKDSSHDIPWPDDYARRGFVVGSIDYRLDGSEQEATDDMQASVRWFKAHADELRIDPERIAVIGASSGAIMALSTGFAPEDPGDSGSPDYPSNVAAAMSISGDAQHPADITAGDPPIAMFHAVDDTVIPFARAEATCDQTIAMGNVCEMYSYPSGGHPPGFAVANREDIVEKSSDFLCRRVLRADACDPSKADRVAPTTADDVPAGYRNALVTVTLSAADTGGSGVYKTYYTTGTDPAQPTTASAVYDPGSKPTLANGERIRYFSTDVAGNAEAVGESRAAKVETAAPTTADDVPAGYRNALVTVTLSAADTGGSGVYKTYYTTGTDPAEPTTASAVYDPGAKPTLADGERIRYFSTDVAGNAEAVGESPAAKVDTAAPSSEASAPTAVDSTTIAVDYTAADAGAGLERVELYAKGPGESTYSLVATDSSPASSNHSFTYSAQAGDGDYGFYTVAYDAVGNAEAVPAGPDATTTLSGPPPPATQSVLLPAKKLAATSQGVVTFALSNPNPYSVTGTVNFTIKLKRVVRRGTARFSIPAGKDSPVKITLSAATRKLLAEKKRLSVRIALFTQGPTGGRITSVRTIPLTAPTARTSSRGSPS